MERAREVGEGNRKGERGTERMRGKLNEGKGGRKKERKGDGDKERKRERGKVRERGSEKGEREKEKMRKRKKTNCLNSSTSAFMKKNPNIFFMGKNGPFAIVHTSN